MSRRIAVATLVAASLTAGSGLVWAQAPAAPPRPPAPTDKAGYWPGSGMANIWKELEAKGVLNNRIAEGGSFSINVRIVTEKDAPLVHATTLDIWVVMEGTATAVTGGKLIDGKKRPTGDDEAGTSIAGGIDQPLKQGDILFVPPGVPHGFKNIKGFRGYLIRFEPPAKK
jgi:mannose-6-phosphate isomerase-like protein (cupin superfamily)